MPEQPVYSIPTCFYGPKLRLWLLDLIRQQFPLEFTVADCARTMTDLRGVSMSRRDLLLFYDRLRVALEHAESLQMVSARKAEHPAGNTIHYIYTNLTHTNNH